MHQKALCTCLSGTITHYGRIKTHYGCPCNALYIWCSYRAPRNILQLCLEMFTLPSEQIKKKKKKLKQIQTLESVFKAPTLDYFDLEQSSVRLSSCEEKACGPCKRNHFFHKDIFFNHCFFTELKKVSKDQTRRITMTIFFL